MNAWCDVFSHFVAVGMADSVGVVCSAHMRTHNYKQKIAEQTIPTETSIPTATKRLNTSHQAFTSI